MILALRLVFIIVGSKIIESPTEIKLSCHLLYLPSTKQQADSLQPAGVIWSI